MENESGLDRWDVLVLVVAGIAAGVLIAYWLRSRRLDALAPVELVDDAGGAAGDDGDGATAPGADEAAA